WNATIPERDSVYYKKNRCTVNDRLLISEIFWSVLVGLGLRVLLVIAVVVRVHSPGSVPAGAVARLAVTVASLPPRGCTHSDETADHEARSPSSAASLVVVRVVVVVITVGPARVVQPLSCKGMRIPMRVGSRRRGRRWGHVTFGSGHYRLGVWLVGWCRYCWYYLGLLHLL
ncbi:hypothetical protein PFISCL1PPCAC_7308, partial [Pristionchus fissidentatus]